MSMRPISSEYSLIPNSIEQATNTNKQVIYNTAVIAPEDPFVLLDFDYIHHDELGKRTTKTTSTSFMLTGDHCVFVMPEAHTISIFENSDSNLQQLIDDLANLKMNFSKLVLVTKDTADDLYEWVMNAIRKAPWYNPERHNRSNILQELGIVLISDKKCQLINALGLASTSDLKGLGITGKKALIEVKNGIVKRVKHENDNNSYASSKLKDTASDNDKIVSKISVAAIKSINKNRLIPDRFTLIPLSIEEAIDTDKQVFHNKKVIDVGESFFSFDFEYIDYHPNGHCTIKTTSTDFLNRGKHCIITLPGIYKYSNFTNADPHLQEYIENLPQLNHKFDKLVIVAKGHAGNLHELVTRAIRNASWYKPELHDKADIVNRLGIVIIPDPSIKLINALGLATDGHKHGIVSKRGLMVVIDGIAATVQYENDPLISDRVCSRIALQSISSLQLPAKKAAILYGNHPTQKITIVGGGIVGAMEAYFAYLDAAKNGHQVRVTIYDKNSSIEQTPSYNIAPSLTADEMLSVVPRGKALAEALSIPFNQPGGINVSDKINSTPIARNFISQVELYREYEEEHKNLTNALLQLGKFSMDLWQQIYDEADEELKLIMEQSNFNPCREPLNSDSGLHDGYRIDLIYNIADARTKAENMKADYVGIGYKNCRVLSPDEAQTIDPELANFCAQHSELDAAGNKVWKKDTVALYRPGGCLNAKVFLPKFYAYLQHIMGQYTNEYGIVKDCFRVKYLREVNGVVYGSGLESNDSDIIQGLKFESETNPRGDIKLNKYKYESSEYVFAPGENVGLLTRLGMTEPAYAAFAGASLVLRIPIPQEQLEAFKDFNHCMEVHQVGVVLAWQARRIGDTIFIGVAGTKAFYGDSKPNKDEEFATDRNLLQFNMINDVLPQFVSMALQRDTKGEKLTAEDLLTLEHKNIALRWAGNRGVVYDGGPILGFAYKHDGKKIENAGITAYLGSGGVSNAIGAVAVSRDARGKDSIFGIPDVESLQEITKFTSAKRKIIELPTPTVPKP